MIRFLSGWIIGILLVAVLVSCNSGTAVMGSQNENVDVNDNDLPDWLESFAATWTTDWDNRSIDLDELLGGGPLRDGIPSIDNPGFISTAEATDWLPDNEPVIYFEHNGIARAYPLQILMFHEIVNDVIDGKSIAVTFCPLCNSAVVFDSVLDGVTYKFGVSGLLRNSDLVMYDRQTESLWQQAVGECIVGELNGERLTFLPSSIVSYGDFRASFPSGEVLDPDSTGRPHGSYGHNPYSGYDSSAPFLFDGEYDSRMQPMERVVGVIVGDSVMAYPYSMLGDLGVVHDTPDGKGIVVLHSSGTSSALDDSDISEGRDIGAAAVYESDLNGVELTFSVDGEFFRDDATGSTWNLLGIAVDGPMSESGMTLTPIVHGDYFWFAWAAFHPETGIYGEQP